MKRYWPRSEFATTKQKEEQRRVVRDVREQGDFDRLTPRQRVVLNLWIGSDTRWPVTFSEAGRVLGISHDAAVRAKERAFEALGILVEDGRCVTAK